jgi:hypothetical protein
MTLQQYATWWEQHHAQQQQASTDSQAKEQQQQQQQQQPQQELLYLKDFHFVANFPHEQARNLETPALQTYRDNQCCQATADAHNAIAMHQYSCASH